MRQGFEPPIPMHPVHPLAQLLGSRPAGRAVQLIQFGQNSGIRIGVIAHETRHGTLAPLEFALSSVLGHQAGHCLA